MRLWLLFPAALCGCSTVQSRTDEPAIFERATAASLRAFEGCFSDKTAKQNVQYLPRENGSRFSAGLTTGAARFVTWVVDVDDAGSMRVIKVYASRANGKLVIPSVLACA